jgi:Ca-activated chloride channel family protein
MLLRDSPYKGSSSWDDLIARARASLSFDPEGYRAEFVRLAEVAQQLAER